MIQNKELFSPGIDAEGLKSHQLMGNKVSRPSFKVFKVFVQSTGSGVRHLKGGTSILYQVTDTAYDYKSSFMQLLNTDTRSITEDKISN